MTALTPGVTVSHPRLLGPHVDSMEVEGSTADITVADNLPGTSVTPPNFSVGVDPPVTSCADGNPEPSAQEGDDEAPPDERREGLFRHA